LNSHQKTITATASGGKGTLHYQWYEVASPSDIPVGTDSATYLAVAAGTYYVKVTDENGCTATSNQAVITNVPDPTVSISPTSGELNCLNNHQITITATANGGKGTLHYQWYEVASPSDIPVGTDSATYLAVAAGTYYVKVTDENGCTATSNQAVITYVTDVTANPNSGNICYGNTFYLNGNPSGGTLPYTHSWTGDNNAALYLSETDIQYPIFGLSSTGQKAPVGVYHLTYTVTDSTGCSGFGYSTITVQEMPDVWVSIIFPYIG
jgi:large repetitive protein